MMVMWNFQVIVNKFSIECVHKHLQLYPILSQVNLLTLFTPHFSKIYFNNVHLKMGLKQKGHNSMNWIHVALRIGSSDGLVLT